MRKELLAAKGVGRETADSILLYAFNKPIFVIDACTRRIAARHLLLDENLHYDILQKIFMDALPADVAIYNEYHALIVALCKESINPLAEKFAKKSQIFHEIFSEWTQKVHSSVIYLSAERKTIHFLQSKEVHHE